MPKRRGSVLAATSGARVPSFRVSAHRPRTTSTTTAPNSVVLCNTRTRYVLRVVKVVDSKPQFASYCPTVAFTRQGASHRTPLPLRNER